MIISLYPSVGYFYLFSFSYTIVITFKCTIKNQSAGRGGPPDGGGPHAMAQMAQWLIRHWSSRPHIWSDGKSTELGPFLLAGPIDVCALEAELVRSFPARHRRTTRIGSWTIALLAVHCAIVRRHQLVRCPPSPVRRRHTNVHSSVCSRSVRQSRSARKLYCSRSCLAADQRTSAQPDQVGGDSIHGHQGARQS